MKKYAVYGADLTKALKEYDTFEEAITYARKWVGKWGKKIRDTELHKKIYEVRKTNNGEIKEKDYR